MASSKTAQQLAASAAALAGALLCAVPSSAQTSSGWPQFGGDSAHSSYAPDPNLPASAAPQLGIKWMANLYSTDLGSPVVAYNATIGKTVAYVGNERADVFAVDSATGQMLWSTNVGLNQKLRATPMVAPDGSVWVGTAYSATLYKLDGATGALLCSVKSLNGLPINGSPMVVTPPGGPVTVYWDSIDGSTIPGPTVASRESDCSTIFSFTNYQTNAGPWATPAYGVSASGEPLVVVGTADNDSTVYAFDALTGARVWSYAVANPAPYGFDIGDGATISAPGTNGFTNGVVYVGSKYGIEYALDLTTGANLWQFNMYPPGYNGDRDSRSSAAFDGNALVFGYRNGVYALSATTGAQIWNYGTPAEVISSPAIVGPPGNEVVAFGDSTGAFRVLGLVDGSQLYAHQTAGYITSSPAVVNGSILIASSDGFLYSYAVGASNSAPPSTAVTSPADGSKVANPNGSLTVSGTSSDTTAVSAVEIAVQSNGASGQWYNAATGTYGSAPVRNAATLATPGSPSSTWSFVLPVPAGGGNFKVFANTVNSGNIVDRGSASSFSVLPSNNEPILKASSGFIAPGGTFTASGNAYKPGEQVTFALFGNTVATATVGAKGNIPQTKIAVPIDAAFGTTSLTATGQTSGKTSSVSIIITNDWTQYGYGALRNAGEPHDPIIANTIDVGPNTILALSWLYVAGAAVNTSPAVVNGVAYIGNDAGVLTAVVTHTGAPQWTYTIPSHASIRSSPAVDPTGSISFGANDGNLYTLSSAGALIRTVALGGNLGNPAIANSKIIIGSDSGNLYSISQTDGTIQWTAHLTGAVHSSPAYDAAKGEVIVGDDSGAITAFDSGTGVQRWQVVTGGAVTATPAISNGNIYIGSADSNFYALKETTGAIAWKFPANSPILAGATVGGASNIAFGTSNDTLYLVTAGGGLKWSQTGRFGNSAIVGVSGVEKNIFVETAAGVAGVMRQDGNNPLLAWTYQTGAGLMSSAAIIDGTAYIAAGDGGLYAFSPNGTAPQSRIRGIITITDQNGWICTPQF